MRSAFRFLIHIGESELLTYTVWEPSSETTDSVSRAPSTHRSQTECEESPWIRSNHLHVSLVVAPAMQPQIAVTGTQGEGSVQRVGSIGQCAA